MRAMLSASRRVLGGASPVASELLSLASVVEKAEDRLGIDFPENVISHPLIR